MLQLFNTQKMKALVGMFGTQTATGTVSIAGFYDGANGTLTRLSVPAATQGTNNWTMASPPEFTKTSDGSEIPGALFHLVKHDPNSFVVIVERISGGPSEPLSGALALTWTRRGQTH